MPDPFQTASKLDFCPFTVEKGGLSWCHHTGCSVTGLTTTMKGAGDEAARLCCTSIERVSAGFFYPNISPVPRAVARGYMNDRSPHHYPYLPYCASLCPGPCVLLSPGVVAATLVCMGAGSQVADLSADLCGPEGTCSGGWGCYGRRTPGPPRLRQGTPSRWRALDPQLYGISVGAQVGCVVGAGQVPLGHQVLGAPGVGGLVARPRVGSGAWDAP
jgi:hypothetical protein